MKDQPNILVGILDGQTEVNGHLKGNFQGDGFGPVSGRFSAKAVSGMILLTDEADREIFRSPSIRLLAEEGAVFLLFNVTIGNRFHWERKEDQTFQGNLMISQREDGRVASINEISLEDYLTSVISSEMNAAAPIEFLKAHAILSRSWLLAALDRRQKRKTDSIPTTKITETEIIRWYDREDHDLFDVCADDHCQRYQGITKIVSAQAGEAVRETLGQVITYQGKVCDTRYSKSCGGLTEEFHTAWEDKHFPYLESVSDSPLPHPPVLSEQEATAWIHAHPEAYCHTDDKRLLKTILPDDDRGTKDFFRWKVEYSREDLEEILLKKSGLDFGTLQQIVPLRRGPSGRISCLKIVGSKRSMIVGKELEIRRWLSGSHLLSSAFTVEVTYHPNGEARQFILRGAGWGHGVGLCQIGAAVMATGGLSAEDILKHYFRNVEITKFY